MFNLNEKYFPISERCGRNHQNKFLFTSPKETFSPWELNKIPQCNYRKSAHLKFHDGISISRDSDCNKLGCQTITRCAYKHPFWSWQVMIGKTSGNGRCIMHQFENRSDLFIQYLIENSLLNSLNHIYQPVCLWLIVLLNIQKGIERHLNLN